MALKRLLARPLFCLGIFLLLATIIAGIIHKKLEAGRHADKWVEHTHKVLSRANELNCSLHEAESSQRGHAATGMEEFLDAYHRNVGNDTTPGNIDTQIAELQELVKDNAEQSRRLTTITEMIARKRMHLGHTIKATRKQAPVALTEAQKIMASTDGIRLMEEIQRELQAFRAQEAHFLRQHQERAEFVQKCQAYLLIGLGLLLVAVMVIAFITIRKEFTNRQSVERTLREALGFQQTLLHSASYAIIVCDLDGIVRIFNQAAETLTGYRADEVVGKETPQLWHVQEEIAARAEQLSALYGVEIPPGMQVFMQTPKLHSAAEQEWTFVRKNGHRITVELSVTALPGDQGEPRGYLGIANDISERKQVEQMKNEFISTVSHELRTPLTSIRGALGLITGNSRESLSEQVRQLITIAYKNSERLVRLVNNILDIEKIESGQILYENRLLDIDTVIAHSVEEINAHAQKSGVRILVEQNVSDAHVMGDEDRLLQVLGNLLSNAIKYSPTNGKVLVSAERKNGSIHIAVQDEGPGIPDAFKPRIFGKFAQADSSDSRKIGGTGLGLSISKTIIGSMGGYIDFESEPGRTRFIVHLPEWQSDNSSAAKPQTRRILIVEDDKDIAALLKLSLEQDAFACDCASTIASAREHLAAAKYDAMTLDLTLPDEDSISFVRELSQMEETMDLPVIVISANAETGKKKLQGDAIGVRGWLSKPIDFDQLKQLLVHLPGDYSMPKILYVEDEADIATVISAALKDHAVVEHANSLKEARRLLKLHRFDLAILDIMLPDGKGLDLLSELAARPQPIPVIILSVSETPKEIQDRVVASLVKSRVSEDRIVETIKSLIKGSSA